MEKKLEALLEEKFQKNLDNCTKEELFEALLIFTREAAEKLPANTGNKKLYYISAEFLIGKLLSNNLINLGLYEEAEQILKKHGYELCDIEELEQEPSLGNGGLGRLGCLFSGFHCYPGAAGGRYWSELPFRTVSAEIPES